MSMTTSVRSTAPGTQVLFLDLADLQSRHNVVQAVCEATKHPDNPILPLGDLHEWDALQARPWEGRSVIYDEDERLFKCWYAGTDLSVGEGQLLTFARAMAHQPVLVLLDEATASLDPVVECCRAEAVEAIGLAGGAVAVAGQAVADQFADALVVLDHQDFRHLPSGGCRGLSLPTILAGSCDD